MAIFQPCRGRAVLPQQAHDDVPEEGEVLHRVVYAHQTLVLAEGHIERPVHAVFYAPVGAHCEGDAGRVGRQAGYVVTAFHRNLVTDPAHGLHRRDRAHAGPQAPLLLACEDVAGDAPVRRSHRQ